MLYNDFVKLVKSHCVPIYEQGIPELNNLFRDKNSYYFTLELAKQLGAYVVFVMKAGKSVDRPMELIYSYVMLSNGFNLDAKGYFKGDYSERLDLIHQGYPRIDKKYVSTFILTVEGAEKVLKDNGYNYSDTGLKRQCRFYLRNYIPVCLINSEIGKRITSIVGVRYLINDIDLSYEDPKVIKASLIDVKLTTAENQEVIMFSEENKIIPLSVFTYNEVENIGWALNMNWYERNRRKNNE